LKFGLVAEICGFFILADKPSRIRVALAFGPFSSYQNFLPQF